MNGGLYMFTSITIIGAGAFGYAIAFLLSKNGHTVNLYDVNTTVLTPSSPRVNTTLSQGRVFTVQRYHCTRACTGRPCDLGCPVKVCA